MSELRLAAVNGQQIETVDRAPVLEALAGMVAAIDTGMLNVDKVIIVAQVDGTVDYTVGGTVTLAEATGLLQLASRQIERDKRGD